MTSQMLKDFRKAHNLTMEKMAREIGCTLSTYARWEKGESTISPAYERIIGEVVERLNRENKN